MSLKKIQIGRKYEQLAKEYLAQRGYTFLAENYRTKYGELDLIFKVENVLVIVEVKYRKKNTFCDIKKSVDIKKIKRILKTTEIYITENKIDFQEIRLDVVFIEKTENGYEISHFINWS